MALQGIFIILAFGWGWLCDRFLYIRRLIVGFLTCAYAVSTLLFLLNLLPQKGAMGSKKEGFVTEQEREMEEALDLELSSLRYFVLLFSLPSRTMRMESFLGSSC